MKPGDTMNWHPLLKARQFWRVHIISAGDVFCTVETTRIGNPTDTRHGRYNARREELFKIGKAPNTPERYRSHMETAYAVE